MVLKINEKHAILKGNETCEEMPGKKYASRMTLFQLEILVRPELISIQKGGCESRPSNILLLDGRALGGVGS